MSKASLEDFLGLLVDAALAEPPAKRSQPASKLDSVFGYATINMLEHSGRMLQKNIKQILDAAPTLAELDSLSRNPNVDDFTKGEIKTNNLVRMAAALKTKYAANGLPIFDQILQEKVKVLKQEAAKAPKDESPQVKPASEEKEQEFDNVIPLPKIESLALRARVFQHKSMSANKTYLDDKEIISQHNERLEFLGDSVLNTMVTRILYDRFPYAKEGQLSQMRSTLVCNKTLAEFSQSYNFHLLLRCNIDEEQLRIGRQKVYADIFEAYVGALSMERGYDLLEVQMWLTSLMDKMLRKMGKDLEGQAPVDRNAKAELYALVGSAALHPQYLVVDNGNGVDSHFKVHCVMEGEVLGEGEAPNHRDAGLRAAKAALQNNKLIEKFSRKRAETDRSASMVSSTQSSELDEFPLVASESIQPNKFSKNELYAFFGKQVGLTPIYDITHTDNGYKAELKVKGSVLSVAYDASKKNAQSRAATVVLQNKEKLDEFLRWLE